MSGRRTRRKLIVMEIPSPHDTRTWDRWIDLMPTRPPLSLWGLRLEAPDVEPGDRPVFCRDFRLRRGGGCAAPLAQRGDDRRAERQRQQAVAPWAQGPSSVDGDPD